MNSSCKRGFGAVESGQQRLSTAADDEPAAASAESRRRLVVLQLERTVQLLGVGRRVPKERDVDGQQLPTGVQKVLSGYTQCDYG